jgi:hypothetical protein
MAEPTDKDLYGLSKDEVNKQYDKPSAYRSMAYTRTYLKKFREKYGNSKKAYKGDNPEELKSWRKEEWIDIKSFLKDPKNPTKCGNAPIKPGEYPLCMPKSKAVTYSSGELNLLVKRKNEIGKRRLVKDSYLRDVLEPDKIPPIREYKDKYEDKDRRLKLPEPLSEKQAKKILDEKPIGKSLRKSDYTEIKEPKEPKVKPIKEPKVKPIKEPKSEEEKEKARLLKNEKQRARYIPAEKVAKPEKVSIPKPASGEKNKITFKPPPKPIKISSSPVEVTFD